MCLVPTSCPALPKDKKTACFKLKQSAGDRGRNALLFIGAVGKKGEPKELTLYPSRASKSKECEKDETLCPVTQIKFGKKNGFEAVWLTYKNRGSLWFPTEAKWSDEDPGALHGARGALLAPDVDPDQESLGAPAESLTR